jgi:hypothetical protein
MQLQPKDIWITMDLFFPNIKDDEGDVWRRFHGKEKEAVIRQEHPNIGLQLHYPVNFQC